MLSQLEKQTERKKWTDLLEAINQLEIKGQYNIFIMYKVIGFIQSEITQLDKPDQLPQTLQGG